MIFLKAFLKLSVLQTNKMFVNLSAEPYYFFFAYVVFWGKGKEEVGLTSRRPFQVN